MRRVLRPDGGGATPLDERDVGPDTASRCRSRVRTSCWVNLMVRYLRARQGF
ncbi:hypothetical protein ACWGGS_36890 [Streptomyces decoyicus]